MTRRHFLPLLLGLRLLDELLKEVGDADQAGLVELLIRLHLAHFNWYVAVFVAREVRRCLLYTSDAADE